jgi:hypothetical protein
MRGRSRPFWDGVEGRAPVPRAVATLGARPVPVDPPAERELPAAGRPGRLLARGRIVHRDGDLVFLQAVLSDADGAVTATATATATARVIPLRDALATA